MHLDNGLLSGALLRLARPETVQALTNLLSFKEDSTMSKLRNVVVAFFALAVLMVAPAFSEEHENAGCKNGKFIGSYTSLVTSPDTWGDGTNVEHQYILQLNLHSDGTVTEDFSGGPDVMLSFGLSTTGVGSWKCRTDGMLVVTQIHAIYGPTTDAINHPSTVPAPPPVDLFLFQNHRVTYLLSVTDANTLTRIEARTRRYTATEDPTDPTGGVLRPLNTGVVVYTRLVASDADLLAP
jgi:hypothetical protein